MNPNFLSSESSQKFSCECCSYNTSRRSQFDRHLTTAKHKILMNPNEKSSEEVVEVSIYICGCGKKYKHQSSLCTHKKTCDNKSKEIPIISNELLCKLLTELTVAQTKNVDYQKQMVDLIKEKGLSNTNTITNTNSNNTQININMFLNEHCKNAITIGEFIKSIQPTLEDVMYMTKHGNKRGLSKILTTALGQLEITERPLHCTDLKRHTTYVKEDEGWKKEQDQTHIKRMCINAQHECMKTALELMNNDPRFSEPGTDQYEMKAKMIHESVVEPNVEQIAPVLENIMYINRESMVKGGTIQC